MLSKQQSTINSTIALYATLPDKGYHLLVEGQPSESIQNDFRAAVKEEAIQDNSRIFAISFGERAQAIICHVIADEAADEFGRTGLHFSIGYLVEEATTNIFIQSSTRTNTFDEVASILKLGLKELISALAQPRSFSPTGKSRLEIATETVRRVLLIIRNNCDLKIVDEMARNTINKHAAEAAEPLHKEPPPLETEMKAQTQGRQDSQLSSECKTGSSAAQEYPISQLMVIEDYSKKILFLLQCIAVLSFSAALLLVILIVLNLTR